MNALVIGLGMGTQYQTWMKELGMQVNTLDTDPRKQADFVDLDSAINNKKYNIIYIGTPNNTHKKIAQVVVNHTDVLLIEKPGFKTSWEWKSFVGENLNTRIMMVKNNQYRNEIAQFKKYIQHARRVKVTWIRSHGIPESPWFCNPEQSYGGVSRDLMPHLLSYFTCLKEYKNARSIFTQSTDNQNKGVDTESYLELIDKKTVWTFHADWASKGYEDNSITFRGSDFCVQFDLGKLCPAEPYKAMIETALNNISNDDFWKDQLAQDIFIHNIVEKLCVSTV